jgi:hypothetical protein
MTTTHSSNVNLPSSGQQGTGATVLPIVIGSGWVGCMENLNKKTTKKNRILNLDRPTRIESLCWLSYPGHIILYALHKASCQDTWVLLCNLASSTDPFISWNLQVMFKGKCFKFAYADFGWCYGIFCHTSGPTDVHIIIQLFQSCTPVCDSKECKHPTYDTCHKQHTFHFAILKLICEKSTEYEGSHYVVFSSIHLFLPSHIQTFSSLPFSHNLSPLCSCLMLIHAKCKMKIQFALSSFS